MPPIVSAQLPVLPPTPMMAQPVSMPTVTYPYPLMPLPSALPLGVLKEAEPALVNLAQDGFHRLENGIGQKLEQGLEEGLEKTVVRGLEKTGLAEGMKPYDPTVPGKWAFVSGLVALAGQAFHAMDTQKHLLLQQAKHLGTPAAMLSSQGWHRNISVPFVAAMAGIGALVGSGLHFIGRRMTTPEDPNEKLSLSLGMWGAGGGAPEAEAASHAGVAAHGAEAATHGAEAVAHVA